MLSFYSKMHSKSISSPGCWTTNAVLLPCLLANCRSMAPCTFGWTAGSSETLTVNLRISCSKATLTKASTSSNVRLVWERATILPVACTKRWFLSSNRSGWSWWICGRLPSTTPQWITSDFVTSSSQTSAKPLSTNAASRRLTLSPFLGGRLDLTGTPSPAEIS